MSTPALTLDTTIGGQTSNSYCEVDFCDSYWQNHWNLTSATTWTSLTTVQKTNLLMQACRVIETIRFTNPYIRPDLLDELVYNRRTGMIMQMPLRRDITKFYWYQRLQFPRTIDIYVENSTAVVPNAVSGDIYVPEEVKWAQCEQAVFMVTLDYSAIQNQLQGVMLDKVQIAKGEIATTQEYVGEGSALSPIARDMLRPFMLKNSKVRRS